MPYQALSFQFQLKLQKAHKYTRGPQIVGSDPNMGRDTFDFGSQKF